MINDPARIAYKSITPLEIEEYYQKAVVVAEKKVICHPVI